MPATLSSIVKDDGLIVAVLTDIVVSQYAGIETIRTPDEISTRRRQSTLAPASSTTFFQRADSD